MSTGTGTGPPGALCKLGRLRRRQFLLVQPKGQEPQFPCAKQHPTSRVPSCTFQLPPYSLLLLLPLLFPQHRTLSPSPSIAHSPSMVLCRSLSQHRYIHPTAAHSLPDPHHVTEILQRGCRALRVSSAYVPSWRTWPTRILTSRAPSFRYQCSCHPGHPPGRVRQGRQQTGNGKLVLLHAGCR